VTFNCEVHSHERALDREGHLSGLALSRAQLPFPVNRLLAKKIAKIEFPKGENYKMTNKIEIPAIALYFPRIVNGVGEFQGQNMNLEMLPQEAYVDRARSNNDL